jgi:hypothetical protein
MDSTKSKKITPSQALLADLAKKAPGSPLARRLFEESGSVPPTVLAVPQDASDAFAHASAAAEATEQIPPDDSVGRLDDVYQQLASQQLLMDKMAASQAATDEMLATLHAAVAMLTLVLISGSAAVPDTLRAAGVRSNVSNATNADDVNATHQPVSPALQQGTAAAAAEMNERTTREEKNATDLLSVSASDDARHSADAVNDTTTDEDGIPGPQQGTAAATAVRRIGVNALPGDESGTRHQEEDANDHGSKQGTADQDTDATPAGSQQGTAAALESPTACLQMLLKFKDHDPGLFSDSSRRWTTNGPSLYDFIRDAKLALCCSLERKLNRPGTEAFKALSSFVDTVVSVYEPEGYSATSTMIQAGVYNGESVAAEHMDNLVCIAVRRWDCLEKIIQDVELTGRYDRKLCDHAGITQEKGYQKFSPSSPGGPERWMQLRRLVLTFFRQPASILQEKKQMREQYLDHLQEYSEMQEFVTADDRVWRKYIAAGGSVSDQTRIEWVMQKISGASCAAVAEYKRTMKNIGKLDPRLESDWLFFSDVLIMVCFGAGDEVIVPARVPSSVPVAAPVAVPVAVPAPTKTDSRVLDKQQIQALHRYAIAHNLTFSETSLEEVIEDGGVEKWAKVPQDEAVSIGKEATHSKPPIGQLVLEPPRVPTLFPV